MFCGPVCAAGVPRYYLYHKRGLTGLGLVLFHPNIIILRLMHNMIGMGTGYECVTHVIVGWIHCICSFANVYVGLLIAMFIC